MELKDAELSERSLVCRILSNCGPSESCKVRLANSSRTLSLFTKGTDYYERSLDEPGLGL